MTTLSPTPTAPLRPGRHRPRRAGLTLPELATTLALAGLAAAIALPIAARATDRLAVQGAISAIASAAALARTVAVMRGTFATLGVNPTTATLTVTTGRDTILRRRLADGYPLTLSATRPTITFEARGLGYGAANTRIIARLHDSADTLWTSRLGRVRH